MSGDDVGGLIRQSMEMGSLMTPRCLVSDPGVMIKMITIMNGDGDGEKEKQVVIRLKSLSRRGDSRETKSMARTMMTWRRNGEE